jgi:hypothetical protein
MAQGEIVAVSEAVQRLGHGSHLVSHPCCCSQLMKSFPPKGLTGDLQFKSLEERISNTDMFSPGQPTPNDP